MDISAAGQTDFRPLARRAGQVVGLSPGHTLFREGDPANGMYVLLTGRIDVTAHGVGIDTVQAGEALGILSLLDGRPRSATAVAVEPSEVAALDPRTFRFLVESAPGFVWFVMAQLGQRLRATNAVL